jgi:PAS domain S-box-containing protein
VKESKRPSYEDLLEQLLALQKRLELLEESESLRDAAERALRESEEKFRILSEQSMMAILVFQDNALRYLNDAFARMVEYPIDEMRGWSSEEGLSRLIHPDDLEFVSDQLARKMRGDKDVVPSYPLRLITSKGEVRWAELFSKTVLVGGRPADLATLIDITDRKRAEEDRASLQAQILNTQKLESLGLLAGGIAHDFNNLLCGVLGSAELALNDLDPGHPARQSMEDIYRAAEQATELCRQMLAYAGHSHPQKESVDLSALVEDMRNLFNLSLAKNVRVETRLMPSPPKIHADASQLRQVLLNLAVNASEALEGEPGTLSIETGAEDCTREILLTGRGLGLASTLGIIRGHEGAVEVTSAPGEGTQFCVRFPTVETARVEAETPESGEFVAGGAVLLVDDEETVRLVTQRLLESLGFVVMSFEGGEQALAFFSAQPKAIRMALVDLTMPGLNGEQVLERLREKNPQLPVLITSGFDEEEAARDVLRQENTAFLAKPFGLDRLKLGIGRLLGDIEPESDAAEGS